MEADQRQKFYETAANIDDFQVYFNYLLLFFLVFNILLVVGVFEQLS